MVEIEARFALSGEVILEGIMNVPSGNGEAARLKALLDQVDQAIANQLQCPLGALSIGKCSQEDGRLFCNVIVQDTLHVQVCLKYDGRIVIIPEAHGDFQATTSMEMVTKTIHDKMCAKTTPELANKLWNLLAQTFSEAELGYVENYSRGCFVLSSSRAYMF